ncbi:MFS transporter [Emcibacter nanhaiensis]|uniref:MFS transporter n=1 Tax=Emcibacter nanhaiensis TaxID=1505037 RepID=A0A501PTI9_9PROT|nr:MFS transporter [Emcibacter nanhaiensis]TPD63021.1 MFS transporter [Emcibacter nanhaiensis]
MIDLAHNYKRNIALLCICQAFILASSMTLITYAVLVGQMLAPSPLLSTVPMATGIVGASLMAVPASYFMKYFGRKRGFQFGALCATVSGSLAIYALYIQSFSLFCFATLLHGIYQAFAAYYRFAAMEVSPPDFQKQGISLVLAGGILAALVTPTITGFYNDAFGPFTFAGPCALVVTLSILAHLPMGLLHIPHRHHRQEDHEEGQGHHAPKANLLEIIRRPAFICAVLNGGGAYFMMSFIMAASPIAVVFCGFENADAATVIQVHVLFMFIPAFFTGTLIARFGNIPVILAGMVFYAIAAAIAIYDVKLTNFYLSLALVGVAWNFMFTSATSLLSEAYSETEKAFTQGINDTFVYGMTATASLTSGMVFATLGWASMNIINYSILGFLFLVTLWYIRQTKKQAGEDGELPATALEGEHYGE